MVFSSQNGFSTQLNLIHLPQIEIRNFVQAFQADRVLGHGWVEWVLPIPGYGSLSG